MFLRRACAIGLFLAAAWLPFPVGAVLVTKRYELKTGVVLEIGVATPEGARLDTVQFVVPAPMEGQHTRSGGVVKAEVAVSNTAAEPIRVGIAMAIFDGEQRLLGVASGGTGLTGIPPGRQKKFDLVFGDVNNEAPSATTFLISLEPK